jgi:hypothetical protein
MIDLTPYLLKESSPESGCFFEASGAKALGLPQISIHAAIVPIPSVGVFSLFRQGFTGLRRRFAPLTEQGKYAENAMIEKMPIF